MSPEARIGVAAAAEELPPPRVSQMFPRREKLAPREVFASGGGLLVASVNGPQLFMNQKLETGRVLHIMHLHLTNVHHYSGYNASNRADFKSMSVN